VPDLKAVSQNLINSNLSITDDASGVLSDSDVEEQIMTLGKKKTQGAINWEELLSHLEATVAKLKQNPW